MSASMAEEVDLALGSFSVREDRVTLAAHVAEWLAANGYGKIEDAWDRAIEAAADGLETAIEYQWNGNPRRPNNYRSAARNVRTTTNPYRSPE